MSVKAIRNLIILFLLTSLVSCKERSNVSTNQHLEATSFLDTLVGSKIVTEKDLVGSETRKRAKRYFIVVGKDTSDFDCIIEELKDSGRLHVSTHFARNKTYRQQLNELRTIFSVAKGEFDFDSLSSIWFGRLIETGDLSIAITKELNTKFRHNNRLGDNNKISAFLKNSQLNDDWNTLLRPFNIKVDTVLFEMIQFVDKEAVYKKVKIEARKDLSPNDILDCSIWMGLVSDHHH